MSRKRSLKEIYEIIKNTTHCELLSTEYINTKTKLKFKCECGNVFESTLDNLKVRNKQYCNECSNKQIRNRFAKTHEQFEKEIFNKLGEEYIVLSKYKNTNTKVTIKHLKCGNIWEVRPASILNQNCKCPKCNAKNIKKTIEQFKKEVYDLVENEYEVLGKYIDAKTSTLMKHNKCGNTWEVKPTNFLTYHSCPFCSSRSRGEEQISNILTSKNILFEREKRFDNCRGKRKLPFDFYLVDYNILIEYDGIQHFKPSFNEKEFKNIKINDEIKNKYCKENNIKLLRIPYWEFDNIETILKSALD